MPDGDVAPTNQQQVNQQAPQSPQPLGAQGRPGFFRSLLAQLLTGVQAGVMAPQSAQGPSQAADIAQALPQQRIQQQQQQQGFQSQQDLTKARTALAQVQLQQTQLMVSRMSQEMQDSFLDGARKMAGESIKAGAQPLFDNVERQDAHDKVIELLRQDPDAHVMALPSITERGKWSVIRFTKGLVPKAYSVPLKGQFGVPDESIDVPQNMDLEDAKNMVMQRSRDHAARVEAAGKVQAAQASSDAAMARTKLSINAANWRAELHESNANARARMAQANKSTDTQYINLIKQYNQKVAQADKWAQDNKISAAIGWKDNPYQQEVDAYANIVSQYEQSHPDVVKGMQPASPSAAKTGAKIRVKLSDGRTGSVDEKDFDTKTMTKVQ